MRDSPARALSVKLRLMNPTNNITIGIDLGELPATLDALVPGYLPAVPRDYLDGQPIRYSREFRAVWSVGSDHFTVTDPNPDPSDLWSEVYLRLDFATPALATPAIPVPPRS